MSLTRRLINETAMGNVGCRIWDITGDTSYASGGYPTFKKGFAAGREILGIQAVAGNKQSVSYGARYDTVNDKLIITTNDGTYPRGSNINPASMVTRETVTVTANVGQLSRIPGYIISVRAVGGTAGAYAVIPVGKTPTTTQVAVNWLTGVMTFLSTDAVTSCIVQYIPLGVGPFVPANRVIDEAVVFGSGAGDTFDLASRAGLIQYIWNNAATGAARLPTIQPVGESPATGEIAIDINNSAATTITNNNAQDTNAGLATYWKFSGVGLEFGWTDDADITTGGDSITFTETLDLPGLMIPGYGVMLVGEATTTNHQDRMVDVDGTVAANVSSYDPAKGKLTFNASEFSTLSVPYIVLSPQAVKFGPAEIANGVDLSGVTFRITIMSRGL